MGSIDRAEEGGRPLRDPKPSFVGAGLSRGAAKRLHEAVDRLPPIYAGVIRLHYLHGYDTRTTGELLGIPRTTVKMRLHRGRKKLRALMEEFRPER